MPKAFSGGVHVYPTLSQDFRDISDTNVETILIALEFSAIKNVAFFLPSFYPSTDR